MGPVKHMGTILSVNLLGQQTKTERSKETERIIHIVCCLTITLNFGETILCLSANNSWKVIRIHRESLICKYFCPFLQTFAHFLLLFVDRQLILAAPHRARTFNRLFLFSPIWWCLLAKWSISANSNWGRSREWFRQKFERCIWQEAATGLRILFSAPPWLDASNIHGMRSKMTFLYEKYHRNKSFTWLYPHMAISLERDGHVAILLLPCI